jgi:hypothetical protein
MSFKSKEELFGDDAGFGDRVPVDETGPVGHGASNRGIARDEPASAEVANRSHYALALNDENLNDRILEFETSGLDAAYRLGAVATPGGGRVITADGGPVEIQGSGAAAEWLKLEWNSAEVFAVDGNHTRVHQLTVLEDAYITTLLEAGEVRASEYTYGSSPARSIIISLTDAMSEDWFYNDEEWRAGTSAVLLVVPLNQYLRHEMTIVSADFMVRPGADRVAMDQMVMSITYQEPNWAVPGAPSHVTLASELDGGGTNSRVVTVVAPGSTIVDRQARDYSLRVRAGVGSPDERLHALRLNVLDLGPRNH